MPDLSIIIKMPTRRNEEGLHTHRVFRVHTCTESLSVLKQQQQQQQHDAKNMRGSPRQRLRLQ